MREQPDMEQSSKAMIVAKIEPGVTKKNIFHYIIQESGYIDLILFPEDTTSDHNTILQPVKLDYFQSAQYETTAILQFSVFFLRLCLLAKHNEQLDAWANSRCMNFSLLLHPDMN